MVITAKFHDFHHMATHKGNYSSCVLFLLCFISYPPRPNPLTPLTNSSFTWCDRLFGTDVCWQSAIKIEKSGKTWTDAVNEATLATKASKAS